MFAVFYRLLGVAIVAFIIYWYLSKDKRQKRKEVRERKARKALKHTGEKK